MGRRFRKILCILVVLSACQPETEETISEEPIPEEPEAAPVSFVTFGDWGVADDNQRGVAAAIGNYCNQFPCDFVLTLGDNFYNDGIDSTTDLQWQTKYKDIYGSLNLPFYPSLGNHDYAGNEQAQIDYSLADPTWRMAGRYYSVAFPEGNGSPVVEIFVFDTENFDGAAQQWMEDAIDASSAVWKVLAMHVPIISVGPHGDDERNLNNALIPIICNKIDLVLSGHDHIFAHLRETVLGCPIEQLVIGTGGAGLYDADETDPRLLSSGEFHGFGWFEATEESVVFKMIKSDGTVFYTTSWAR
jgi:3',5'-cyclic AMP phosphodiesterase CpdA